MSELLNSITSDNLILLCVIMGVIALILAISVSIEVYNNNKKYQKELKERQEKEEEIKEPKLNIKESKDIKYVEEDSEIEKTKAKIELANLREKLRKEEEEKQKLLEMNLALSKNQIKEENDKENHKEEQNKVEVNETVKPIEEEKVKVEVIKEKKDSKEQTTSIKNEKQLKLDEALEKVRVVNNKEEENIKEENSIKEEIEILDDYREFDEDINDEENAIISYEELKNSKTFGYTDEEMDKYVDEKDAIISIQELEKLYLESQNIEVPEEESPKVEFEMKKVEDLPEIADKNNFQKSPFISPVYGMTKTDQDLILEQTANLEKLNEEIKKTNEFLKTLKDLKKNLQ